MACPRNELKSRVVKCNRTALHYCTESFDGNPAKGVFAAFLHLRVTDNLFDVLFLCLFGERAVFGKQCGHAGENALCEHIAEVRIFPDAKAAAEGLHA